MALNNYIKVEKKWGS